MTSTLKGLVTAAALALPVSLAWAADPAKAPASDSRQDQPVISGQRDDSNKDGVGRDEGVKEVQADRAAVVENGEELRDAVKEFSKASPQAKTSGAMPDGAQAAVLKHMGERKEQSQSETAEKKKAKSPHHWWEGSETQRFSLNTTQYLAIPAGFSRMR